MPYTILLILIVAMVATAALASMEGQIPPPTTSSTNTTTTAQTTSPTTTTAISTRPFDDRVDGVIPYGGGYPVVTEISYVAKDGTTITGVEAYSGLVVILTKKGTKNATVVAGVEYLGGELVLGVPVCGYYWARVTTGEEAGFISNLWDESWVDDAFPCTPIDLAQKGITYVDAEQTSGWFWDAYDSGALDSNQVIIDAWSNDGSTHHGTNVSDIASGCTSSATAKSEVDVYYQPNGTEKGYINGGSIVPAIALTMINAKDADRVTAINLSLGYRDGLADGSDRHGVESADVTKIQTGEYQFLAGILHGMEVMGQPYLDHILISIAAGNMGVDLTGQLADLREKYPNAWDHVIIAGGLDGNNERIRAFNTSENPDDIIYAQMPAGLNGTSFAAPQFTCLATALAGERPDLSSWEIKKAILEAAPVIGTYRTKPTLAAALAKANELFPRDAPTPDISGTWSGTYTSVGKNPRTPWSYNDGGELTWDIKSVSDGYFSGTVSITGVQLRWDSSGEVAGYTSCSGTVSGRIYGNTLKGTYSYYVEETGSTSTWNFTATLGGNTIGCEQSYVSGTSLSFSLISQGNP
ncbi:MAG: S8/S53 family peptidase [Candidatus Hadarchaeum sp.]|uniref:S8/S53 family peptidase n=1 Tax=Candidatus Hadarchaeum sp. TaxID=2883567 RepID=UPI003D0B1EB7